MFVKWESFLKNFSHFILSIQIFFVPLHYNKTKGDMDYIVVEINGVRHELVKDDIMHNACAKCTLRSVCGENDICTALGNIHGHFEIE
jgi:hypothetical protein